jgi:outer membrane protein assembly factor BamB
VPNRVYATLAIAIMTLVVTASAYGAYNLLGTSSHSSPLPPEYASISSQTSSPAPADWTMFHGDPSRCGYISGGDATNSAKLLWAFPTNASVDSSPVTADGFVIVGSQDGHIYCLNNSNGQQIWCYPLESSKIYYSPPAISQHCLYIGSSDGNLNCIHIPTGLPLWKTNLNGAVWSSPLVLNGLVYAGSQDCNLYCLNASTGLTAWAYPTEGPVSSSPAYSDGVVYFGSYYYVYAVDAATGQEVWHSFTQSGSTSPTLYNGCLYIGALGGNLFCLDAYTGVTNWKYATHGSLISSPAAAYGCVYEGSEDSNIYCLNASTGKVIWHVSTGFWVCSSPIVSGGNVYVCSQDYKIYCLDAFTGAIKWHYTTGDAVDSSPAIADNTLYVGSNDHYIYALRLCNSTEKVSSLGTVESIAVTTVVLDIVTFVLFAVAVFMFTLFFKSNRHVTTAVAVNNGVFSWCKAHFDLFCVLAILVFSIALFFAHLENHLLWVYDEQIYSQWSYHMLKTGDYLTPWNFGIVSLWIGKPPLNMWLVSIAYQIFGVTNFSSRIWSALFGCLSMVLTYYFGKLLYNRYVGLLSAFVLGTFTMFYTFATRLMTDMPLVFFMLTSLYLLLLSEKQKNNLLYSSLSGLFFGLALMTKQTEALLIPAIAIVYLVLTKRTFTFLKTKWFTSFLGVAALIFAPWLIVMSARFGFEFWNYYFLYSTYLRVVSPFEGHVGGFLFYFNYLAANENLFWLILLPFAVGLSLYWAFKRSKSDILIIAWVVVVFLVFTIAQTKLYYYILPVYPAFALAVGSLLGRLSKKLWCSKYFQALNRKVTRILRL